jgi:hypothetical protein
VPGAGAVGAGGPRPWGGKDLGGVRINLIDARNRLSKLGCALIVRTRALSKKANTGVLHRD